MRNIGWILVVQLIFLGSIAVASPNPKKKTSDPCSEAIVLEKGITPPALIKRVEPEFQTEAEEGEHAGTPIIAEAVITTEGTVACVKILRSNDPSLNKSLLDALSQWKYKPALKRGKPVAIRFTITTRIDVQ